jgi:hypothetical protein
VVEVLRVEEVVVVGQPGSVKMGVEEPGQSL